MERKFQTLKLHLPNEVYEVLIMYRTQLVGLGRSHKKNDLDITLIDNYVYLANFYLKASD